MQKVYDVVIVGGGVAGMTAGIYSARAGAEVLILEKNAVGGQAGITSEIQNYPAFMSISGFELVSAMQKQVQSLGVEMVCEEVTNISDGELKTVRTPRSEYCAKTVILCLGANPRKLGIENEREYIGKGVSYCAVCDGAFFRGKTVAIVGGGNSAVEEANYLSKIADKVFMIVRRDELKAQKIMVDALSDRIENKKIEILFNSEVVGILGENKVEKLVVKNNITNKITELETSGLFIAVGRNADTEVVESLVECDKNGYIIVNENKETSVKGIYSAGDCTNTVLRQIITACSDGAIAGTNATIYARKIK